MDNGDYNWIDDPFDERKGDRLGGMTKGARTAFVLAMVALAILLMVLFVLVGASLLQFASA